MSKFPWVCEIQQHTTTKKLFPFLKDHDKFFTWCSANFKVGQKVWMFIEHPTKSRTHRQFRYLFGVVYPLIAEHIGCSIEEIDGVMRRHLLIMNPDSPMEYIRNKSSLDRTELAEYIDGVRREAAMMGVETPDPPEPEVKDVEKIGGGR